MITEQEIRAGALEHQIPDYMVDGLVRYFVDHIRSGDFLMAVIANDLCGAVGRADPANLTCLPNYARFLYWVAPGGSWGSEAKVKQWLASGPVQP